MEQTTWVNPISGEKEIVETGSARHQELTQKLHDAGLWDANDPNKPEGGMTPEEFDEYIAKEKAKTVEERLAEYYARIEKQANKQ